MESTKSAGRRSLAGDDNYFRRLHLHSESQFIRRDARRQFAFFRPRFTMPSIELINQVQRAPLLGSRDSHRRIEIEDGARPPAPPAAPTRSAHTPVPPPPP